MAAINIIGIIDNVCFLQDAVLLFVSEFRKGYRKSNGTVIEDKSVQWKVIYKPYFKKFISEHFNTGMLVEVKGDILPYAIEHEKIIEGYSVIGQTINLHSYPRPRARQEARMIRESQNTTNETPNLEDYNTPDF